MRTIIFLKYSKDGKYGKNWYFSTECNVATTEFMSEKKATEYQAFLESLGIAVIL